jgi:hypothetical protein
VSADVLSLRQLNRATLERHLLLRRHAMAPLDAVARRRPRAVTAGAAGARRELRTHGELRHQIAEVDAEALLAVARPLLDETPRTQPQLKALLTKRFPDWDPRAMSIMCRNLLALVQAPPRGVWGRAAQVTLVSAPAWLGRPLREVPVDEVVLRFLPEYDNARLSHADRGRFLTDDERRRLSAGPTAWGTLLVDGRCVGTWRLDEDRKAGRAVIEVYVLDRLAPSDAEEVEAEGARLVAFLGEGAEHRDLRVTVAA